MVCDESHHEETTASKHRSDETHKSYTTHDSEHQDDSQADCEDHCAACLHTALTQSSEPSFGIGEASVSYPSRGASSLLSRTASIDRPPCWTA